MPAKKAQSGFVSSKVNDSKDNNYGYNALTGEYEDLGVNY
jgi:hypothetical protein